MDAEPSVGRPNAGGHELHLKVWKGEEQSLADGLRGEGEGIGRIEQNHGESAGGTQITKRHENLHDVRAIRFRRRRGLAKEGRAAIIIDRGIFLRPRVTQPGMQGGETWIQDQRPSSRRHGGRRA